MTVSHLFPYQNPYLVDAPAVLAITVAILSVTSGRYATFTAVAGVGVLIRSTVAFAVPPIMATGRRFWTVAAAAATAVGLAAPLIGSGPDTLADAVVLPELGLITVVEAVVAYGWVWIPMLAGLLHYRGHDRTVILSMFASLSIGAALTMLVAADIPRLLSIIHPVGVLLAATTLGRMETATKQAPILLAAVAGAGVLATFPTLLAPPPPGMAEIDTWYLDYAPAVVAYQVLAAGLVTVLLARSRQR